MALPRGPAGSSASLKRAAVEPKGRTESVKTLRGPAMGREKGKRAFEIPIPQRSNEK